MFRYIREVRDGIKDRLEREAEAEAELETDTPDDESSTDEAQDLLSGLKQNIQRRNAESCFRLPVDNSVDHADLRKPSLGLPPDCVVKPYIRFLLLKPQITLRSEADPDAIVLLAVEEFSLKSYKVFDKPAIKGEVVDEILTRSVQYGSNEDCAEVTGITDQ
jgi:hypothetical protein